MFERKIELSEGEKLFLDSMYNLILDPEVSDDERKILISAKTELEKTGYTPRVVNYLMQAYKGKAISRTLTKPISKFYVSLYQTNNIMSNIDGGAALSASMIPIWSGNGSV